MAGTQAKSAEAAARYAQAVFELADEAGSLEATGAELARFAAMVAESQDLTILIESPAFRAEEKARALIAVAQKAGLSTLAANLLGTLARNGRARDIPGLSQAYAALLAERRGEVTAEVTSARPLGSAQREALATTLRRVIGRDVRIDAHVAPDILGGLIVKIGSRQFDSSLKTKLQGLKTAMKGA